MTWEVFIISLHHVQFCPTKQYSVCTILTQVNIFTRWQNTAPCSKTHSRKMLYTLVTVYLSANEIMGKKCRYRKKTVMKDSDI